IIVMNFAENGSLRNYLNRNNGNIPWDHKLYLLREISNGLNEIHERGLIHRNFHSGNILITKDFKIYITDLGLNKPANMESEELVFGVIPYMAPEVLKGRDNTQESDIYSFGMIAYEI
ncbi:kinase-like domain-containing protein, partial [Glomus cerebriforme]